MCQPKSKGGQRCTAHTRPHYEKVMRAITTGSDEQAAAEVTKRFDSVRDFAMIKGNAAEVQAHVDAIEEHYFANPSTSIAQEVARQTTLATLRAAMDQGDQRKAAIDEAKAAVKDAQQALDVDGAEQRVAQRRAAQQQAAEAQRAEKYAWALSASSFDMKTDDPTGQSTQDALQALTYRMENMLPGDKVTVSAHGDTMSVSYDEEFDTFTGKTKYLLRAETDTSFSTATFISREHITADINRAVFGDGAWQDRRTLSNPKVAGIFAKDYDDGLVDAAQPYIQNFDDFHAEYTRLYKAAYAGNSPRTGSIQGVVALANLKSFTGKHQSAMVKARRHIGDLRVADPSPENITKARTVMEQEFVKSGVATYEQLCAEDEKALESARVAHRAAVDNWNAEQKERQDSVFKRLLPSSPPPTMPTVERRTTPHPFGHMTREEWVAYETENLKAGQTDLSEFSTYRGRAPKVKDPRSVFGDILDGSRLFEGHADPQVA